MGDISRISPDGGQTIYDIKDSKAVHYGEQSKGYVGKNLLKRPYAYEISRGYTNNGLSFTVSNDGKLTINGTKTNPNVGAAFHFANKELTPHYLDDLVGKEVVLSGSVSNYSSVQIWIQNGNKTYTAGTPFTLTAADLEGNWNIAASNSNSGAYNNVVVSPMLRLSSISDSTYEPYLPPNTEIDNKLSYADNAVLGAKNLLENQGSSTTINGLTFTVNDDKSVTVNGTSTAYTGFKLRTTNSIGFLENGNYIVSDGIDRASITTNMRIGLWDGYGGGSQLARSDRQPYFEVTETNRTHTVYTEIIVDQNQTINNITIYPMIRLASDTDDTYAKYAMTNRELTENLIPIEGSIDYTHTESTTTPSPNATREHLYKCGNINVLSIWCNGVSITQGAWKELCRVNFKPTKETGVEFTCSGRSYYAKLDTNGTLSLYLEGSSDVSNAAIVFELVYV